MYSKLAKEYKKDLISLFVRPLAEKGSTEVGPQSLETSAQMTQRMEKKIEKSLDDYIHKLESAVKVLKRYGKWPETSPKKKSLGSVWDKELEDGKTPQEMLGFKNQDIEMFYTEGYELYNRQNYKEAGLVFLFLCYLNPLVSAFWLALGAAEEKLKDLKQASEAYLMACELDDQTLDPYLQAAKCHINMQHGDKARMILSRALERIKDEPHLASYKDRLEKMMQVAV